MIGSSPGMMSTLICAGLMRFDKGWSADGRMIELKTEL